MSELSLPTLFRRSLEAASKSVNLPTINDNTQVHTFFKLCNFSGLTRVSQELIQSALQDLRKVHTRIRELSLFSPNEILDDISTKNLVYLTLPYVLAELENRVRTTERPDRMAVLTQAIVRLQSTFRRKKI